MTPLPVTVGVVAVMACFSWMDASPITTSTPDPTPLCTPWCEGGQCMPIQVTKLDEGVCTCSRVMLKWTTYAEHVLWVKEAENNTMVVKWKLKNQPPSGSSVLYLPMGKGGVCFNITTNKMPAWVENVKISCTHGNQTDTEDPMFRLLDVDKYENIAVLKRPRDTGKRSGFRNRRSSKRRKSIGKRATTGNGCECWTPDTVSIQRVGNTSLEVLWKPFAADSDLRVRIVPWDVDRMEPSHDKIISLFHVCEYQVSSWRFSNLTPGYYVGMVGSLGCDCVAYVRSDPFQLEDLQEKSTVSLMFPASRSISKKDFVRSNLYIQRIAVVVAGVLAVIGCASLLVMCLIKNWFHCCSPYHTISKFPKDTAKPKIVIVEGNHNNATTDIATWIKDQLIHSNNDVLLTKPDKLSLQVGIKDLIVLVSLQDIQTFKGPMIDDFLSKSTITVLMDYSTNNNTDERCPLVVHVPIGFSHSGFKTRNNETDKMQILGLGETLKRLSPECDLGSQDVVQFFEKTRDFAENRRNEIRRIFLISGCDHPLHVDACMELTKMLRILEKEVIYLFEATNRKAIQQSLPVWTMNQANWADLVLVVGSEVLFKLVQSFENETDLPNNLQNQSICAPMTLRMLSDHTLKSKIAFVSFGYGSEYIDRITGVYPFLSTDMRYDLVETRASDDYDLEKRKKYLALTMFFSRLSAGNTHVQSAVEQSSTFFKKVETMAAMMANDSDWFRTTYGSVESLVSLITLSDRSVIFSHSGVWA